MKLAAFAFLLVLVPLRAKADADLSAGKGLEVSADHGLDRKEDGSSDPGAHVQVSCWLSFSKTKRT